MPCYHPRSAWQSAPGQPIYLKPPAGVYTRPAELRVPCMQCLGCDLMQSRAWALRCHLELQQHDTAAWANPTYAPGREPVTLSRQHLQLFLKRLRSRSARSKAARAIRFFASGEYGETNGRPHFHVILFGIHQREANLIEDAWGLGICRTYKAEPANIAYTAGYTAKKIGWRQLKEHERVDSTTGEVYTWQPPFIQMSRRPGLAAHAKQHAASWRLYAIHNGMKQPVPRYLHEAWKATATNEQLEELAKEKQEILSRYRETTPQELEAGEKIAAARQRITADKRKL